MAQKPNKQTPSAKKEPVKKKSVAVQKKEQAQQRQKEKELKFDKVILAISEGSSLRKSLVLNNLGKDVFYLMCDKDQNKAERYARACDERADAIFEDMFDIADDSRKDTKQIYSKDGTLIDIEDKEWTSRVKLQIDVRKWALSKMRPTKYGERIEVQHSGDINVNFSDSE